ncbi:hypothetical protein SUDANB108_01710 [Streptomyces sp. enrichment culture]|uniref:hypothetical protein n=1 Tax=Streptomyces sp. enrichment culture TaxID=1795815 RepID=UPI003F54F5A0
MKLGKALATGIAEERPMELGEGTELPGVAGVEEVRAVSGVGEDIEESVAEGVPAVR